MTHTQTPEEEWTHAWRPLGEPAAIVAAKAAVRTQFTKICESPIEVHLATSIAAIIGPLLIANGLELRPQYPWLRYRIDFAIVRREEPFLFIECDGRDYHSTPEQLANDKRKDDAAATAGIALLRFSGSEIYKFVDGCVQRVLEHLAQSGAI